MKYVSKFIYLGITLELCVLAVSYAFAKNDMALFFQLSARFSGRVSLLFFSMLFIYATLHSSLERESESMRVKFIMARDFAVVHIIHCFFLIIAIKLRGTPLVPVKLIGGAFAYLLIILIPFVLKVKWRSEIMLKWIMHLYLVYVWMIFFITYVSRVTHSSQLLSASFAGVYYFLLFGVLMLMVWRLYTLLFKRIARIP